MCVFFCLFLQLPNAPNSCFDWKLAPFDRRLKSRVHAADQHLFNRHLKRFLSHGQFMVLDPSRFIRAIDHTVRSSESSLSSGMNLGGGGHGGGGQLLEPSTNARPEAKEAYEKIRSPWASPKAKQAAKVVIRKAEALAAREAPGKWHDSAAAVPPTTSVDLVTAVPSAAIVVRNISTLISSKKQRERQQMVSSDALDVQGHSFRSLSSKITRLTVVISYRVPIQIAVHVVCVEGLLSRLFTARHLFGFTNDQVRQSCLFLACLSIYNMYDGRSYKR